MAKGKHVRFASQDIVHEIEARPIKTRRPMDPLFWNDPIALRLLSRGEARPQDCDFVFEKEGRYWKKITFNETDEDPGEEADRSIATIARYRSIPCSPALSPLPPFSPPAEAQIEEIIDSATVSKDELGQWWMHSRTYNRLLRPAMQEAVLRRVKSRTKVQGERAHEDELMKQLTPALESWANRSDHEHEAWTAKRFPEFVPETAEEIKNKREEIAKVRADLEAYGCPPCYPSHILYPFHAEGPPIVEALGGYERSLFVQKEAWEQFLSFRSSSRKHQSFETTLQLFEKRRKNWGFQGEEYSLQQNPNEQDILTTWLEFQNYELSNHSRAEADYETQRYKFYNRFFLTVESQISKAVERQSFENAAGRLDELLGQLNKYTEYLPWIEQHRLELQETKADVGQKDSTVQGHTDSGKVPASSSSSDKEQSNEKATNNAPQDTMNTRQTEPGYNVGIDTDSSPLSSLSSETPTTPQWLELTRNSPLSSVSTTPERPLSLSATALQGRPSSSTYFNRSRTGRILKKPVRYAEEHYIDRTKTTKTSNTKREISTKQKKHQQTQVAGEKRKSQKQKGKAEKKIKVMPVPYQTGRGRKVVVPRRYPEPD